jgi:hypothetical protein
LFPGANYQSDKELWRLYYFVMGGDENVSILINSKMLHEVSSLKEKRKASASLKLVPGLTGNFEHQLFLRDYVVESLKNRPGKPLPVKVAPKNKISRAAKESRRPPYLYQSLFRFSSSRCCCFSLNRSSSRCFSRSLSNCLPSPSPLNSRECSNDRSLSRGDCSAPGVCS